MTPAGLKKIFDEVDRQFESLPPWKKSGAEQFLGCSGPLDIRSDSRLLAENHVEDSVKQLTPVDDEAYVRARWVCISAYGDGLLFIYFGKNNKSASKEFIDWHHAYLFTVQREAEIAELEQEIEFLKRVETYGSFVVSIWQTTRLRILAREQAALAELLRGWKGKA